jgi:hypothetical protein
MDTAGFQTKSDPLAYLSYKNASINSMGKSPLPQIPKAPELEYESHWIGDDATTNH